MKSSKERSLWKTSAKPVKKDEAPKAQSEAKPAETKAEAPKPQSEAKPAEEKAEPHKIEPKPEELEIPDIPYDLMTVEQLQAVILAKMAKNGPVTERMRQDVVENIWHNYLVNWANSFKKKKKNIPRRFDTPRYVFNPKSRSVLQDAVWLCASFISIFYKQHQKPKPVS